MKIEKYLIYGARKPASRTLFDEHMEIMAGPGQSWHEFRTDEVVPAVTYAAHYFVDAVQDLLFANMRKVGNNPMDIELQSGWRVKTVDLGLHWKRHLELINTRDPDAGFIVEGQLECNTKPKERDRKMTRDELARDIIGELNASDLVVKNNQVTEQFDPAESERFSKISVYPYRMSEGGYHQRAKIVKRLAANEYVHESFEHHPHDMLDARSLPPELRSEYSMISISSTGRRVTPGEVMQILPILSDFLSAVDRAGLDAAYVAHIDTVHYTLEEDLWHLLASTRSCLGTASSDTSYPPSPFVAMVDELWKRAACADVLHFLTQINEAAAELIDLGHDTAEKTFACNDGRTRVYATTEGDVCKAFVNRDDFGVCVSVRSDRIVVSTGDYHAGSEERVLFDFTAEDGVLTGINEVVAYDDLVVGILRRTMVDLSSVHCHIVSDPKPSISNSPTIS
jgi:hypothetical protein